MTRLQKCANGRQLMITSFSTLKRDLSSAGIVPCVVLLNVEEIKRKSLEDMESLIRFLIHNGCQYFVSVGKESEKLHDKIDDLFLENEDILNRFPYDSVITTFHESESLDDAIFYYVNATEIWNAEAGALVAIINDSTGDITRALLMS